MDTIAARIKCAREALGLTQFQLADAIKVSRPAVTQWETGVTETIKAAHLLKAAKVLHVSPDWLLYGDPLEPSKESASQTTKVTHKAASTTVVPHIDTSPSRATDKSTTLINMIESLSYDEQAVVYMLVNTMAQKRGHVACAT